MLRLSGGDDRTINYNGVTMLLSGAILSGSPATNPFSVFYGDTTPTSPNAMDDEFTGTLNSSWTARNNPGAVTFVYSTWGYFDLVYNAGFGTFRGYSQQLPGTDCTFVIKITSDRNAALGNVYAGIGLIDNVGTGSWFTYGNDAGLMASIQHINTNLYGYNGKTNPDQNIGEVPYFWIRVQYIVATTRVNVDWSANGWQWKRWRANSTITGTPTRVIIGGANNVNETCNYYIDYFRRTA